MCALRFVDLILVRFEVRWEDEDDVANSFQQLAVQLGHGAGRLREMCYLQCVGCCVVVKDAAVFPLILSPVS